MSVRPGSSTQQSWASSAAGRLYALQATIPTLTRSSLHRCFQRHGNGRLPEVDGDKPARKKFKAYPIGYFHVDVAEVRTAEGKLCLFVAIDRTSKLVFVRLVTLATPVTAKAFLEELVPAVPYKIHTILTDNGIQFADLPKNCRGPTATWRRHPVDRVCRRNGIGHRLTRKRPCVDTTTTTTTSSADTSTPSSRPTTSPSG